MVLNKSDVESALVSKGFTKKESHHHFFVYVTSEGKFSTIFTKTSHSPKHKVLSKPIESMMAKQCKLSNSEFRSFVECTLSQNQYETLLKKNGHI